MRAFLAILVALGTLHWGLVAAEPTPKEAPAPAEQKGSVVRVNSTNQAYDFFRPWSKEAPFSRRGLGVLIDGGHILVTAELVANSNYIELERADGGEKTTATVQVIDYEANLATLQSTDPKFLDGMQPLQTTTEDRRRIIGPAAGIQRNSGFHEGVGNDRRSGKVRLGRFRLSDVSPELPTAIPGKQFYASDRQRE
jgi:hypothetical protein